MDTLEGVLASVDGATKENLDNLVKEGEKLLKNKVTGVNLDTGAGEPLLHKGSNEEELKRFILFNKSISLLQFEPRKRRCLNSSNQKLIYALQVCEITLGGEKTEKVNDDQIACQMLIHCRSIFIDLLNNFSTYDYDASV